MGPMPTPTFAVPPPDDGPTLDEVLGSLRDGRVRPVEVARLSDLSRDAVSRVARTWPSLDDGVREALVRQIGELSEDRIELNFGRVLRLALDDPSPEVRQRAVSGLWEDEGLDLRDRFLALAATDPSQDVRAEAARGLVRFVDLTVGREPVVDDDPLRVGLLAIAEDDAETELVRRRAIEAVGGFGTDGRIAGAIRDAYDGDDEAARLGAVAAMGRSGDARWLPDLLAEIGSDDAEMRFEAVQACGELGDDRALAPLAEMIYEDALETDIRQAVVVALGRIGGPEAARILRELGDDDEHPDAELIEAVIEEALLAVDPLRFGP